MGINIPKIEAAHAILRLADKYILQLRDDKPDLAARGKWSLFGGRINPGETPLVAIRRELFEELSIRPKKFEFLWQMDYDHVPGESDARVWFFTANVDDIWDTHRLAEGRGVDTFSFDELKRLNISVVIRGVLERYHLENENQGCDSE